MSTKEVKNNKSEETNTSEEELYFLSYFDTKKVSWVRCPLLTKGQLFYYIIDLFNRMDYVERINIQTEEKLNSFNEGYCPKTEEWIETSTTLRETLYDSRYQKTYERHLKNPQFRIDLQKLNKSKEVEECLSTTMVNDDHSEQFFIGGRVQ